MEKTDKSAEEFFKAEVDRQWREQTTIFSSDRSGIYSVPYILYPAIYMLMDNYAAHQISEYKKVINDLLPEVEEIVGGMKCFPNHKETIEERIRLEAIINRAKALLQESNQGQPPQESEQP